MSVMDASGSSVYKTWLLRIHKWKQDPQTPLTGLPPLKEDSFSTSTYTRLVTQMMQAVNVRFNKVMDSLAANLQHSTTDFERQKALIEARSQLREVIAFSRIPELPKEVSEAIHKRLYEVVEKTQQAFENPSKSNDDTISLQYSHDRTVQLARENSLLRAFDDDEDESGVATSIMEHIDRIQTGSGAPATGPLPQVARPGVVNNPAPPPPPPATNQGVGRFFPKFGRK